MSERRRRCRFWPDCSVHRGEGRLMTWVGESERLAILAECGTERHSLVAARHGLTYGQVYRLLRARGTVVTHH